MSIKIHKLSKETLTIDSSIVSTMSSVSAMTIDHYVCSNKSASAVLPYTIETTALHVPIIEDVEFCISVNKSVDMLAIGPNSESLDNDVGKYDDRKILPEKPIDLPPGFVELYKVRG